MIKPIQSSQNTTTQSLSNHNKSKASMKASPAKMSQLQAAETKYNLACLLAATTQLENVRLKQELANAAANANYYKACG